MLPVLLQTLAADLASHTVEAGINQAVDATFGTDEQRALRRIYNQAYAYMLAEAAGDTPEDLQHLLDSLMRDFIDQEDRAVALFDLVVRRDHPPVNELRDAFNALGYDAEQIDFDQLLDALLEGIDMAVEDETSRADSGLFNRLVVMRLSALMDLNQELIILVERALQVGGGRLTINVRDIENAGGAIAIGENIRVVANQPGLPREVTRTLENLAALLEVSDAHQRGEQRNIRIFLSSPSDVTDERGLVKKAIEAIQSDPLYKETVRIELVDWVDPNSRTPFIATKSPQQAINENLAKPSECDIVIVLFWARMGTLLPEDEVKPEAFRFTSGHPEGDSRYFSGTEWEYVDAAQHAMQHEGGPLVAVYRRMDEPQIGMRDPEREVKLAQFDLVEAFFTFMEDQARGYNKYEEGGFATLVERDLRILIADLLRQPATSQPERTPVVPADKLRIDWPANKSPFPGLRAFTPNDEPVFFGRAKETAELVRRIVDTRFLAILGASGSGKSSLVGAGLIPRLNKKAISGSDDWFLPKYYEDANIWSGLRFTPGKIGNDPFIAVAIKLESILEEDAHHIANHLHNNPTNLIEYLHRILSHRPEWAKVLVFIDQFEELFTLVNDHDIRRAFIEALMETTKSDRVRTILTMRSEFAEYCAEYPALNRLINISDNTTYYLRRPDYEQLYEMITQPATVTGLKFEDGLEWRILNDAGNEPGALALTAYALEQLWQERDAHLLTIHAYNDFGGVKGAIGMQAEKAFHNRDGTAYSSFDEVFRQLVEINPQTGAVTRRRAILKEVTNSNDARELVEDLVHGRLLVTGREAGLEVVEVAHEALFNSWQKLAVWIESVKNDLILLQQVTNAAKEWAKNDYGEAFRWPHERLILVYDMLERLNNPELDSNTHLFIEREYDRLFRERNDHLTSDKTQTNAFLFHRKVAEISDRLDELGDCDFRPGVGVLKQTVSLKVDLSQTIFANAPENERIGIRLWGDESAHIGLPDIVFTQVRGKPYNFQISEKDVYLTVEGNFPSFLIAKYPVTYAQYSIFINAADGYYSAQRDWWEGLDVDLEHVNEHGQQVRPRGNHPAEMVSWYDCIAFCRWLNSRLGWPELPALVQYPELLDYQGIRLPTEWEWQFAAQNGNQHTIYPWGNEYDEFRTNTSESKLSRTIAVGMYPPDLCGAYDLHGNVFEWCINDGSDLTNNTLQHHSKNRRRSLRGRSWFNYSPNYIKPTHPVTLRGQADPKTRNNDLGFRLVYIPKSDEISDT